MQVCETFGMYRIQILFQPSLSLVRVHFFPSIEIREVNNAVVLHASRLRTKEKFHDTSNTRSYLI